jgi:hypothetical protein
LNVKPCRADGIQAICKAGTEQRKGDPVHPDTVAGTLVIRRHSLTGQPVNGGVQLGSASDPEAGVSEVTFVGKWQISACALLFVVAAPGSAPPASAIDTKV